jgi:hypothetical protein
MRRQAAEGLKSGLSKEQIKGIGDASLRAGKVLNAYGEEVGAPANDGLPMDLFGDIRNKLKGAP